MKLKKKKLCGKRGFSLAELLIAMLIMALAGMIVMGGIAVATRVFQDLLLHSQTQLVMKEYMSELRAGFRSADLDAELNIDSSDNPAFAHSGLNCSGYFIVSAPDADGMGTIMFQPTYYDYTTGEAYRTRPDGWAEIPAVQLISSRLSEDVTAKVEYTYDADAKMFSGELTVKSNGVLSSGEHVELVSMFGVTPIN